MITKTQLDNVFSSLKPSCGGRLEDYFGLLYLEKEHAIPRERAINQVTFGNNDYGIDGFHFDRERRILYLFQFKYSSSYRQFAVSLRRLIDIGFERIFIAPNKDDQKNPILHQLRSSLTENKALIDNIYLRFIFTGDPAEADRSTALEKLREDLEDKKFYIDSFFGREVGFTIEFKSTSGRVGVVQSAQSAKSFSMQLEETLTIDGPAGQTMHLGIVPLSDLYGYYQALRERFFDSNIRFGLGEEHAVNRAIDKALKRIVIEQVDDPSLFTFFHNGVTLAAEKLEKIGESFVVTAPRLLNGAQTVTSAASFLTSQAANPMLQQGRSRFDSIRVLCKIITNSERSFITTVTVNNNRQNPVESWNLHANDDIQLQLQDKFKDSGLYYERQENAFSQLSPDELDDLGVDDSKAVELLRLTQLFILTDGNLSKLSELRRVFEDDATYSAVFRPERLDADTREIVICYKIERRLRKVTNEILEKGENKYVFVRKSRNMLWALLCQAILNSPNRDLIEDYGKDLQLPADFTQHLINLATTRVRPILSELIADPAYQDNVKKENFGFLRTDAAFKRSMKIAQRRWGWVHKRLI